MKLLQHYIAGKFVAPAVAGERFPVINPATEQTVAEIAFGSAADVDLAVKAARKAFPGYAALPLEARIALVGKLQAIFERRYDEMVQAITTEMGAPYELSKRSQAACGPGHIKATIDAAHELAWE